MYSWSDVAERTETVYRDVLVAEPPSLVERLQKYVRIRISMTRADVAGNRYYLCGPYFGKVLCIVIAVQVIFLQILEFLCPAKDIDVSPIIELKQHHKRESSAFEEVKAQHQS